MKICSWVKKALLRSLAILNLSEGIIHISVAALAYWGMYDTGLWDWRIMMAPTTDFFLGIISLITGVVLGKWSCSHAQKDINSNCCSREI